MKKLILLVVLLAGCTPATSGWMIDYYTKACANRGGVQRVDNILPRFATCADGFIVWANRPTK